MTYFSLIIKAVQVVKSNINQ